MKRLFLAVDLDDPTRQAVASMTATFASRLREVTFQGRMTWVRADHLHLTLRFLGDISPAAEAHLATALSRPFSSAAFLLTFEAFGVFPSPAAPRVLWLGVKTGGAELRMLHQEVHQRLAACGLPPEDRPFRPHLTLGRFRSPAKRLDLHPCQSAESVGPTRIDRVTLYESRLSGTGPTHTALLQVPLRQ